jgi:hypothetical protein
MPVPAVTVAPAGDCRQDTAQKPVPASLDAPVVYLDLDSIDANKRSSDFRSSFSAWEAPR